VLMQTRSLTLGAMIGAPTVREGLPEIATNHTVGELGCISICGTRLVSTVPQENGCVEHRGSVRTAAELLFSLCSTI
jgi:hypothetical protein